ncbi:similar to Saccharomyces cerevisiae YGR082W TOM20 Component of the TOM (translocase of outer membrane) complex responsible for recognition and initial import steps for all mitochondrially directed proteins [Maudiozyma saulgeensis]|uniref:Similar to Saccharomyces cerevisiae YGR082W TOM20 Component of the TOM (Translocase of outer membrane) complex responsible for recognition and initial import steps for all mitochondrially directed... n=1 Tax=Maudiozyma saulgeensis TaxID=1789683 RepID=A0A1X7QXS1_9SACH|nr:similar to Saccharomyces cerevisiae YGR082W TOM20 Component of the TOM (translocase of outer membrane) complex responsible for recognition and initial import steps for all mitochondrially directed proteins [Kazachstania saulgeensis]
MSFSRIFTVTTVLAAVSTVGYALYFDYQRRNNPEFRHNVKRRIRKQQKSMKLEEQNVQVARVQAAAKFLEAELEKDPIPTDVEGKQLAFNINIEQGDQLAAKPGNELEAASKFYKALTVYPNPADLLGIYSKSLPELIYENLVLMIAAIPPANISTFLDDTDSAKKEINQHLD